MRRLVLGLPLLLCACISDGYVMRSVSVDAAPRAVGFTITFDNIHLPEMGDDCLDLCVSE